MYYEKPLFYLLRRERREKKKGGRNWELSKHKKYFYLATETMVWPFLLPHQKLSMQLDIPLRNENYFLIIERVSNLKVAHPF